MDAIIDTSCPLKWIETTPRNPDEELIFTEHGSLKVEIVTDKTQALHEFLQRSAPDCKLFPPLRDTKAIILWLKEAENKIDLDISDLVKERLKYFQICLLFHPFLSQWPYYQGNFILLMAEHSIEKLTATLPLFMYTLKLYQSLHQVFKYAPSYLAIPDKELPSVKSALEDYNNDLFKLSIKLRIESSPLQEGLIYTDNVLATLQAIFLSNGTQKGVMLLLLRPIIYDFPPISPSRIRACEILINQENEEELRTLISIISKCIKVYPHYHTTNVCNNLIFLVSELASAPQGQREDSMKNLKDLLYLRNFPFYMALILFPKYKNTPNYLMRKRIKVLEKTFLNFPAFDTEKPHFINLAEKKCGFYIENAWVSNLIIKSCDDVKLRWNLLFLLEIIPTNLWKEIIEITSFYTKSERKDMSDTLFGLFSNLISEPNQASLLMLGHTFYKAVSFKDFISIINALYYTPIDEQKEVLNLYMQMYSKQNDLQPSLFIPALTLTPKPLREETTNRITKALPKRYLNDLIKFFPLNLVSKVINSLNDQSQNSLDALKELIQADKSIERHFISNIKVLIKEYDRESKNLLQTNYYPVISHILGNDHPLTKKMKDLFIR